MELVTLDEIRAARRQLAGIARETPVEHSRVLGDRSGATVWLKCENLQRAGSFKIRGAYRRISRLAPEEQARGVAAASAGNHAQGVALAASLLGATATVFMPARAALPKVAATRGYGAEVHLAGDTLTDAFRTAGDFAESTGSIMIHPFDHPDVIAGQATVGLEILDQVPDVGTIIVPMGGGGLVAGIAAAVKRSAPTVRVIGVQAEQAAAWPASLAAGRPLPAGHRDTMADGIAVELPGTVTFGHVSQLVDEVITVGEESLSQALLLCLERAKLMVEPSGAAAAAALLEYPGRFANTPGTVCAVLSGGNIDPLLLLHVIQHGLAASGRFFALRARITDVPGELAALLSTLGELGANVIDVSHSRIGGHLPFGQAEVALSLETRGSEHQRRIFTALHDAGYSVDGG